MSVRRAGLTLIELLISGTLLAMLLGMAGGVLLGYLRATQQSNGQRPAFRSMAHGVEALARELRTTARIYAPDEGQLLAGYAPVWHQNVPLVVGLGGEAPRVVGYAVNPAAGVVQRVEYGAQYDAALAAGDPNAVVLAKLSMGDAAGLEVQLQQVGRSEFLRVRVASNRAELLPLETVVRIYPEAPSQAPSAEASS